MSFSEHLGKIDPTAIDSEFFSWAGNSSDNPIQVDEQLKVVDVASFVAKYPGLKRIVETVTSDYSEAFSDVYEGQVEPEVIDAIIAQSVSAAVITIARYAEHTDLPSFE